MLTNAKASVRCAVYSRKSSEEGLEQLFNSLDAQREACHAYITSQRHEGWRAIATRYDDGGFSGGTLDRPALTQLLNDVKARKIDAVVVYKVDRLTRSLADFAKIVEIFDAHEVSFVSVTQQFNTTTSMGRLTLNVLLSFAQFERELTGERIRDKIAASKRKGMWMGGRVPFGYDLKDRRLVVNPREAEVVREIYRRYLDLGCVRKLKLSLDGQGIRSKERTSKNGGKTGGHPYSRGALYKILQKRLYLGEIEHHGQIYLGEHEGIVPRELWEEVQRQLDTNKQAERNGSRARVPSLLVGMLYDENGNRFTPAHAVKNGKRYRYYVSQKAIKNPGIEHPGPVRIPAAEIEDLVCARLASFLESASDVIRVIGLGESADVTKRTIRSAQNLSKSIERGSTTEKRQLISQLAIRIVVCADRLELFINRQILRSLITAEATHVASSDVPSEPITLAIKVRIKRCGGEARLILPVDLAHLAPTRRSLSLIRNVVRAHDWHERILQGELRGQRSIAEATGISERHVFKLFHCAFLAPDILESILDGRQPALLKLRDLRRPLPIDWTAQRQLLGFRL